MIDMKADFPGVKVLDLLVSDLVPSETNPRREFDEVEQRELMDSIESVGVISVLLVRPKGEQFEIVAGERRWRAAKALGRERVPCRVRDLSDEDVRKIQLVENIQRSTLSPLEELRGLRELEEMGIAGDDLASSVGKSSDWCQLRLNLGKLPEVARDAIGKGKIDVGSVPDLLEVDAGECEDFVGELLELDEVVPVPRLRAIVSERYKVPREGRERWFDFLKKYDAEGEVEGLSDPEDWAQYVRPYGEGVGKWKLATDRIGGLAADSREAGLTWGELAKAHGVRRLLVPVNGVRGAVITAVELVDRSVIDGAEKAAREAGQPYTLGAKRGKVEDSGENEGEQEEPEQVEPVEPVKKPEEKPEEEPEVQVLSDGDSWTPWAVRDNVWPEEEFGMRVALVGTVLDRFDPDWRARVHLMCGGETSGLEDPEKIIFYVLAGLKPEDLAGRRLATLLGVYDFWVERVLA